MILRRPGLWAVVIYLASTLPGLTQVPLVTVDEPWYANTAHNLVQGHGLVNTNVGWRGGDQFFLYTVLLAGPFAIFDTSLIVGRLVSVACGLLSLAGLWRIGARLAWPPWLRMVGALLLAAGNLFFVVHRRVRPEALVVTLAVWGVEALLAARATPRAEAPAWRAGLMLGLAFLAHPNGALLVVLGGVSLLVFGGPQRRWVRLAGYMTAALACVVALGVHLTAIQGTPLAQVIDELLGSGRVSTPGAAGGLAVLGGHALDLWQGWSLGWRRALVVLIELAALSTVLLRAKRDPDGALVGSLGWGFLLLGVLFMSPLPRPALVVVELLAVLALLQLVRGAAPGSRTRHAWLGLALIALANQAAGDVLMAKRLADVTDYRVIEQGLAAAIPSGSVVVAPLPLWFGVRDSTVYTPTMRWQSTPYPDLTALLDSGTVDRVILSSTQQQEVSPTTGLPGPPLPAKARRFLDTLETWARVHATHQETIETRGYGRLEVWARR